MKQNLAGKGGEVKKWDKVPHDVRFRMQESFKEFEEIKRQSKNQWEDNPFGDANLQEIPAPPFQVKGKGIAITMEKSKKRKASGLHNYFAPRTTPGSQPSIKNAMAGIKDIYQADLVVAEFFFDSYIPINAINSPNF
ncbi:hypothetical protein SLA2020_098170 [Shorea laevis]